MRLIQVADTTLFHVSAVQLGDATQWYRIAELNNLSDPDVVGVTSIRIPDQNIGQSGGTSLS